MAKGAKTAIMINAGVYETFVIWGINQFTMITDMAATVPARPAKVPTEGPFNKSLESVCMLPMANWKPNSTIPTMYIKVMGFSPVTKKIMPNNPKKIRLIPIKMDVFLA